MLASTPSTDRVAPGLRRLQAARQLALNEPWDAFALWLSLQQAEFPAAGERLRELLALLTPDIAVCGLLLGGPQASRWSWRSQQAGGGPLPTRPAEDIPATVLKALGIKTPPHLPGMAVDFSDAGRPGGYTPQEEREIQKRLEDLGYL